jgi:predicted TIM-barrel fold metal-dependent hydrolase
MLVNIDPILTRRDALKSISGAAIATSLAGDFTVAATPSSDEGIIDTHVHIVTSRLDRGEASERRNPPFDMRDEPGGKERFARLVEKEMRAAGVTHALCMPTVELSDEDPLGIKPTVEQAALVKGVELFPVGMAHPERFDVEHLSRVEVALKEHQVKAFKAYLGYLHYPPTFVGYRPYYKLAAKYNIPVIFHTGDTYSRVAKVKYAHPLAIDELAVEYPETKFVLAHFGNPWVMDAAQVVYKNENVWAELSAFLIGDADNFARMDRDGVLKKTAKRVREGIDYAEAGDRLLFGSDWPLAPIAAYRDFARELVPADLHAALFRDNPKKLYGLT